MNKHAIEQYCRWFTRTRRKTREEKIIELRKFQCASATHEFRFVFDDSLHFFWFSSSVGGDMTLSFSIGFFKCKITWKMDYFLFVFSRQIFIAFSFCEITPSSAKWTRKYAQQNNERTQFWFGWKYILCLRVFFFSLPVLFMTEWNIKQKIVWQLN